VHCAGTGTGGTPVLPVVETSRGGQATYHGPGQLIGYPIVHLREWHCDLHWYLRQLEEALISSLAALGLKAGNIPGQTGVWIGGRKIASIGVAVRGWVTYHGFALNVNCEMAGFASISPCGLPADSMIRLKDLGLLVGVEELQPVVAAAFSRTFGYESVRAS
jgi:lipoate-protein ligase B